MTELLKSDREVENVLVAKGEREGSINRIIAMCRENKIVVKTVDRKKLDDIAGGGNHQGVAALCAAHEYASLDDIFALAASRGEDPFIVICDRITDPHNLGAIIRSANAAGAHGVIIPKHESVSLNSTVLKAAAGAAEYTPVARVTNLSKTADELRARGVWITGTAADADRTLFEADLTGPVAICIGSEGEGISRLLKEKCDFLVSIPMEGQTESLNASVAGALCMYEVLRTRKGLR